MIPQASLFLGIIPALLLLFVGLKGFQGLYKEKNIFLSFVVGIFLGVIAAIMQSFTILTIVYVVLLAFINQLLKTMILNIGRLQEQRVTVIYGLSLGLGFGSAFTPMIILAVDRLVTTDMTVQAVLVIGTLGIILFHGATGAFLGYGIYLGKTMKYLFMAIFVELAFDVLLGITIAYSRPESILVVSGCTIGLVCYGAVLFLYVTQKMMPKILDEYQRRKRSRNLQTLIK
ncbi:MAG: protease PrsW [Candidatus Thermoplasmatota archaeon]